MSLPVAESSGLDRPKVAIPRLERRPGDETPTSAARASNTPRVSRACVDCRRRKVRCNGGRPRCQNCLDSEQPCVYMQSRKDRLKTATEWNEDLSALLKDLRSSVAEDRKHQIDDLLAQQGIDDLSDVAPSRLRRYSSADEPHEEMDVSAEVGSNGSVDALDMDLLQDEESRAVGFVGKSSEVQWLRRLQYEAQRPDGASTEFGGPYGPPGDNPEAAEARVEAVSKRMGQKSGAIMKTSSSNFYLDTDDIELDYAVDALELPPIETAQRLYDSYMDTVQDTFPILSRTSFTDELSQYYTSKDSSTRHKVSDKWLAILNLVFAIGAKHSHLVQADWQADDRDHIIYQSRAFILGLSGPAIMSHPDLMQIQLTALLALYFLSIGRVNRAWVVIGIALRFAQALGLHIRNEDRTVTVDRKEILLHIWWAVYSLEGVIGTIVGRPSFVAEDYCSAPLPLPLTIAQLTDGTLTRQLYNRYRATSLHQGHLQTISSASEEANPGSYLKSRVQVVRITQRVMSQLYSARTVTKSWKHVQESIAGLCGELDTWSTKLPSGFNFTQPNADKTHQRESLILQMHYLGTKIIITRPCLCRLDSRITNQSKSSDEFNKNTARICVDAAKAISDLIPDLVDAIFLYQTGPWWCLIHNFMQALTVLLLEMSYGTVHFSEHSEEILPSAKKIIRLLRTMKERNRIAERAYTMALEILKKFAPRMHLNISDLLEEDAAANNATYMASSTEDHFSTGQYGQRYPFSAGPSHQEFERQDMSGADTLYDIPTSYASMSEDSTGQYQGDPSQPGFTDPSGTYTQDLSQFFTSYDNPFATTFDEQNPLTSDQQFFSMNATAMGYPPLPPSSQG